MTTRHFCLATAITGQRQVVILFFILSFVTHVLIPSSSAIRLQLDTLSINAKVMIYPCIT